MRIRVMAQARFAVTAGSGRALRRQSGHALSVRRGRWPLARSRLAA